LRDVNVEDVLVSGRSVAWLARLVRDQEVGSSNLPAPTMFSVYILQSEKTRRYYIGSTQDITNRLSEHNSGETKSIRSGIPWKLVYFEQYNTRTEAIKKEKKIKTRGAKRYLDEINKSV
jgi:putative endonuclease